MAKRVDLNPMISVLVISMTLILGAVLLWVSIQPAPMYCVHDGKVMTVEQRAVIEGMEAGVAGKSFDDCPYSSPQREHSHWVRGWLEGKAGATLSPKKTSR